MEDNIFKKVLILGASGLLGKSLAKKYKEYAPGADILTPSSLELNLLSEENTSLYLLNNKPDLVFLCAAKVGGIKSNSENKASFISQNLRIQTNTIDGCYKAGVKKVVFIGSSCIYPRDCNQPMREEYLLTGHLEKSNDAYSVSKIAGIYMCKAYREQYGCDFISVMPPNLYGPGDNYNLESSHVLPALIRKFHEAKTKNLPSVELWGTGNPTREFMYTDDLSDALIFLSENYSSGEIINAGSGRDISIRDLASLIAKEIGYVGNILYNSQYPDGMLKKLMDSSRILSMGWKPKVSLEEGIKKSVEDYIQNEKSYNNRS